MSVISQEDINPAAGSNHPLAFRMAVIAFIANNITIGTLWGSFSVLLSAVETRLGVGRDLSTLAIPAMNLIMAGGAVAVGMIATRYSLRILMVLGAVLLTAGFILLAVSNSYPLYLIAYGLCMGPGMAIAVVLSPTLITRWFVVNRGRTLGIVCTPVAVAIIPLAITWVLQSYGLTASYCVLAALSAIAVIANLFIIDTPPTSAVAAASVADNAAEQPVATAVSAISAGSLLKSLRFWALSLAGISSMTGSIILSAHAVPMAATWGYSPTMAASLLSIQSLVGIVGTLLFGWIADRIGGVRAMALIVGDAAILWALLLLHPPFPVLMLLLGLIGLHGAGVLPVMGLVLSQAFGRENFSRAYGINNFVNLPFAVLCVPLAAIVYTRTGSYSGAIIGQVVFFAIALLLVLSIRPVKPIAAPA